VTIKARITGRVMSQTAAPIDERQTPMSDYPDYPASPAPTRPTDGASADRTTTDEILAVIAAKEPRGATADQIAIAIGLGFEGMLIRDTLEELVDRGLLNQFGIGHGAIYTLNARA